MSMMDELLSIEEPAATAAPTYRTSKLSRRPCIGLFLSERISGRERRQAPPPMLRLGSRELHDLDGLEVDHTTTNALRGVELHEGLTGVRVTKHADALTVHDLIAGGEIAEGQRKRAGIESGHILSADNRITEQRLR